MCVYDIMVCRCPEAKECIESPGTVVIGGHELPVLGTGN